MSHFTVLVVTKSGTQEQIDEQLAPFHEFECTGHIDEFVIDVDRTEEARESYEEGMVRRLKAPDGKLYEPYEDQFYRDPTEEEIKKHGPFMGSGGGGGISYTSKDWGDGKGYRAKVKFIPEGYEEVQVKKSESFLEYVKGYYGFEDRVVHLNLGEKPDREGAHKHGWVEVDENDQVVRVMRRTNPNKQWDWYQIGGRWRNILLLKDGSRVNTARKSDIDFAKIKHEAEEKAAQTWDKVMGIVGKHMTTFETWDKIREKHLGDIDAARKEYHEQPAVKALREVRDRDFFFTDLGEFAQMTREQYIERAGKTSFSTFAFLQDRKWAERGEMHMWAMVSNEKTDWPEQFSQLLAQVPDDHFLTIVDCHI